MTASQVEAAVDPQALELALDIGDHLPAMTLRPAMPDGQQMLATGLDPLDRSSGLSCRDDRQVILLGEVELASEAAPDEGGDDPNRGLGHPE